MKADKELKPIGQDFLQIAKDAASKYGLDPLIILAIAKAESNLIASAVSKPNKNGTKDYGLMQINEINLEFVGATKDTILNPKTNIFGGAHLLNHKRTYILQKLGRITTQMLISSYNQGEGATVKRGIMANAAYVAKVWYWYGIYKLRGGL